MAQARVVFQTDCDNLLQWVKGMCSICFEPLCQALRLLADIRGAGGRSAADSLDCMDTNLEVVALARQRMDLCMMLRSFRCSRTAVCRAALGAMRFCSWVVNVGLHGTPDDKWRRLATALWRLPGSLQSV